MYRLRVRISPKPARCWGIDQKQKSSKAFRFLLTGSGKPIPVFGDGSTARDYTYVNDILDGIMACAEKKFGYEIFNLGESETVKLSQLIELLESALGKRAVLDRQPPQPGDVPLTCADISKARTLLDYQPKTKIEQGIPLFVDWLRENPA